MKWVVIFSPFVAGVIMVSVANRLRKDAVSDCPICHRDYSYRTWKSVGSPYLPDKDDQLSGKMVCPACFQRDPSRYAWGDYSRGFYTLHLPDESEWPEMREAQVEEAMG
mgnify:CR=1 FL=1